MTRPSNNPRGAPRGQTGTVRILVRMDAEIADAVDAAAAQDGRSRDAWVRRAVVRALESQGAKTPLPCCGGYPGHMQECEAR